jgi:hypothetical protein
MDKGRTTDLLSRLSGTEGARALLCMLPLLIAGVTGKSTALVALGQGGFFFSSLFLPARIRARAIMGSIVITLGLGLYLLGGNVVQNPDLSVAVTFLVALNLSFLTEWNIGGAIALTLMMVYTAGLNAGSPSNASRNFIAFAVVMTWCTIVSMLPFWKPIPPPKPDPNLSDLDYAEQGVRMGIGSGIAMAVSYLWGFTKLGWAPSAVSHIVRYDQKLSKARAWGRTYGTLIGSGIAVVVMSLIHSPITVVFVGAFFAVLNGLFKPTKIGQMPIFYTATILLLYTANDLPSGFVVAFERVAYNLVGIVIGVLVVIYPFPKLMQRLRKA